jgi:hypothetical protein
MRPPSNHSSICSFPPSLSHSFAHQYTVKPISESIHPTSIRSYGLFLIRLVNSGNLFFLRCSYLVFGVLRPEADIDQGWLPHTWGVGESVTERDSLYVVGFYIIVLQV